MGFFETIWNQACVFVQTYVVHPFSQFGWVDALDILLLSFILFGAYRFSKSRRAGRVLLGLLVVVLASVLVVLLKLPTLSFIVRLFASAAFFCFVLIFQPEIRDGLERIGNSRAVSLRGDTLPRKLLPVAQDVTNETVDAVLAMSKTSTGALIVFEGLTQLGEYAESGKLVDARVTSQLLQNIFYDKAPLHDGALIIRDMRIWRASCVLPSARTQMQFGNMGTRHRAAVGITEVSDALVIVVSEQTGIVSVAQDGKLLRNVDKETLTDILMTYLAGSRYLRYKRQEAKAAKIADAMAERAASSVEEAKKKAAADQAELSEVADAEPDSDMAFADGAATEAEAQARSDAEDASV